ncbi:immune inhibitor A [bacterium]|nr:immune inhibitor A [bacterium]
MTRGSLIGLLLLAMVAVAVSTPIVEVYLPDELARTRLMTNGFDIADMDKYDARVVGWEGDLERLENLGLAYQVEIENVEEFYRSRLNYELDDMGGYPTFDEIVQWRDEFVAQYGDIVSEPMNIGSTLEDRPMWVIKISDNPNEDEDEPEIFLNGCIHAREVIVPLTLMNFAELLAEGYGIDDRITEIVNTREIWIMPVINVDGYTYNEETDPNGGGMWRKNKYVYQNQVRGVDLNRNFDFMWGYDNEGSSPSVYSQTYRGPDAASEPETQVIQSFVNDHPGITSVINYHSYGNYIMWPYDYDPDVLPEDVEVYRLFGAYINETLDWEMGTAPELLYPVNGDANDWMEGGAEHNVFAYTLEIGTGNDGFWPNTNRIETLTESQEEPLLRFCEVGGDPFMLLPPNTAFVTSPDTAFADFTVSWTVEDDGHGNMPVSYEIREFASVTIGEDVEEENEHWDLSGFSRSTARAYEGDHSFYSGMDHNSYNTATVISEYRVQEGDGLECMVWYDLENMWDFAYVQASFDGGEWINLEGNLTTNDDPRNRNLGNGISGSSDGWVEATFPLDEYTGQSMRLRLAYVTDRRVIEEGIYFDNITPVSIYEESYVIEEEYTETSLTVNRFVEEGEETVYGYVVRGTDEHGDVSGWSNMGSTVVVGEQFQGEPVDVTIPVNGGMMNIISSFADYGDIEPADFFNQLETIQIAYQDDGGVYIPPFINTIGDLDYRNGFMVFCTQNEEWTVSGVPMDDRVAYSISSGQWNMVGFPYAEAVPVEVALSEIEDNLNIVMNSAGQFWIPGVVNTIVNLMPGYGYMYFTDIDQNFFFHNEAQRTAQFNDPVMDSPVAVDAPAPTGQPWIVLVNLQGTADAEVATVSLYDGDKLVGKSVVTDNSELTPVVTWKENVEYDLDGFTEGHGIRIELQDKAGNRLPFTVSESPSAFGEGAYGTAGVRVLEQPSEFAVGSVYPNPFNPSTTIPFSLPEAGKVEIALYNVLGQMVYQQSMQFEAGQHQYLLDATNNDFVSGLYLLRVSYGENISSQKVLLLK